MIQPINSEPNQTVSLYSPSTSETDSLTKKKKLIEEALKIENISSGALQYFQGVKTELDKGVNVPFPNYFHATRYWKDILRSETIKKGPEKSLDKDPGMYTDGVFLSKINESPFYGEVAFAIDEGSLTNSRGHFFYTKGLIAPEDREHSLWVRVEEDVPIIPETLAFIVATNEEIDNVKRVLKKKYSNLVISKDVGDEITTIFEQIIHQPQKSSPNWTPMPKYGDVTLDESSKHFCFHHWWDVLPGKKDDETSRDDRDLSDLSDLSKGTKDSTVPIKGP